MTLITIISLLVLFFATYYANKRLRSVRDLLTHAHGDYEGAQADVPNLHDKIVEVAKRYIGVEESPRGSNRGKEIDEFQKFVGAPLGSPWCTAFVSYVVHKAAQELSVAVDFPRTGWTPTLLGWANLRGRFVRTKKPQKGWVMLLYYEKLGRVAHSGIVVRSLPGFVVTIEGNTDDAGSRLGYKVARRVRRVSTIYGYVIP